MHHPAGMNAPSPDPLTPAEMQALLQPDPRTRAADLLVLRDALQSMAEALDQLALAVQSLRADAPPPPPPTERVVDVARHPGRADAPARPGVDES